MTSDSIYFLIPALIIMLVQSVVLYYFGKQGAVVSTVIFSILGGILWQILVTYGKNMGSNGSVSHSVNVFLPGFFVCLLVLAITNFGLYYLVGYFKTGVLNKPVFFTWLFLVTVPPSLYYGIKSYKAHRQAKDQFENYARLSFKIFHFNEYPVWVTQLEFTNTQNEKESSASGRRAEFYTSELLETYAVADAVNCQNITAFDDAVEIPVGADQFTLGYYSFTEEKYYLDTFKFDFQKYTTVDKYTGKKRVASSRLFIKPEGHADLIVAADDTFLLPYKKIEYRTVSSEEHSEFLLRLSIFEADDSQQEKEEIINKIKAPGPLQKRLEIQQKQFTWNLSVKSPGKLVNVKTEDFRYMRYGSTYNWFNKPVKKHLSSSLGFYVYNDHEEAFANFYFDFNEVKLFDIVNELTQGDENIPVTLLIEIENLTEEGIHVSVTNGSDTTAFHHLRTNIVRY